MNHMRRLRLVYGISLAELAQAAGVSQQRISEIELNTFHQRTNELKERIELAFQHIINARGKENQRLAQDFQRNRKRLFELCERTDNI